ncbi:hypothetical protein ABC383_17760 [Noviherbaspirillum sp. 1P10PC]|uniref:hypothetical protein n=1 Tax=Noviherbaspirillum sp. 1P10PC TaxID=3132292 RepID=UPI00399EED82
MKFALEEMSLLTLRIFSDFNEYVTSRKTDVALGVQTRETAALQVKNYGDGLAKALTIAENLFGIPSSGMPSFVDRMAIEIYPNAVEDGNSLDP